MSPQSFRGTRSRFAAALSLLALAYGPAQAAPAGFCETYTQRAIQEYRRALAVPACRHFVDKLPIRWHDNHDIHFNWCLANDQNGVNSERNARLSALYSCARPATIMSPGSSGCCPRGSLICPMGRTWCK